MALFLAAMANTFLLAQGIQIGASLAEPDMVAMARTIMAKADANGCRIILPTDLVVATAFAANAPHRVTDGGDIADDEMILDAGPQSVATVTAFLGACQTVVWNGPMGAFELKPFDAATNNCCRRGGTLDTRSTGDRVLQVAVTRWQPLQMQELMTISPTYRRLAGPFLNGLRAKLCRVLTPCSCVESTVCCGRLRFGRSRYVF